MRVTERAKAILHPRPGDENERLDNLRGAATSPAIFKKIASTFDDGAVPPLPAVVSVLKREGFRENAAKTAAKAYVETFAYLEAEGATADADDADIDRSVDGEHVESRQESRSQEADGVSRLPISDGDFELKFAAPIGPDVSVHVTANGNFGVKEIDNLIVYLEAAKDVLKRSDGDAVLPNLQQPLIVEQTE